MVTSVVSPGRCPIPNGNTLGVSFVFEKANKGGHSHINLQRDKPSRQKEQSTRNSLLDIMSF